MNNLPCELILEILKYMIPLNIGTYSAPNIVYIAIWDKLYQHCKDVINTNITNIKQSTYN